MRLNLKTCLVLLLFFAMGYWLGTHEPHLLSGETSTSEPSETPKPDLNATSSFMYEELLPMPETVAESISEYNPDPLDMESLYWLALNVYFEARSQTEEGQIAVIYTTMERVRRGDYPNTVKGVVTQAKRTKSGELIKHQCQFSWYCDGKPDRIRNSKAWNQALAISAKTLIEEPSSLAKGATHYHANYVSPYWAPKMRFLAQVDDHLFYRKGALK